MAPTLFDPQETDGYQISFYSNEGNEPPHVHVTKAGKSAKFWIDENRIYQAPHFGKKCFAGHEISKIKRKYLKPRVEEILRQWEEHKAKQNPDG